MTVKLKSLRVDAKRESDGDWIETPDLGDGVAVKVRGINYKPYDIARQHMMRRLGRQSKGQPLAGVDIMPDVGRLLAEHILIDWRGFDEPFDAEKAAEILSDPEYRVLTNAIEIAAQKIGEADIQFVEGAAKN